MKSKTHFEASPAMVKTYNKYAKQFQKLILKYLDEQAKNTDNLSGSTSLLAECLVKLSWYHAATAKLLSGHEPIPARFHKLARTVTKETKLPLAGVWEQAGFSIQYKIIESKETPE